MKPEDPYTDAEQRVLILTPTDQEGPRTQGILAGAGLATLVCQDSEELWQTANAGAGCLLIAEEAITTELQKKLAELLSNQPLWSDLPMVILTRQGADPALITTALTNLGNVTLLERPVRLATLVSAIRSALRGRLRQYEHRDRFKTQALLAAIVASSDDAIVSKTLTGIILSWNGGAQRIFGYSAEEAIGKPITIIIPPERLDEERMILNRLMAGERIDHFETVRIAKDGRQINISLTISPLRDAHNRIIGASKVARDITAQKRAEQALREADRRKDEFLATLAHELRNPLAPIRNSLHILRLAGSSDPAVERVREMMERQVNHLVRLVDDLMEVSRITRGKIELRKEHVELAAVVRSAVETSQPLIQSGGHQLALALPPEPLTLDADPVRLAQVLANLLNNAAKYTPMGGQIWLSARRENQTVVVSVQDNGVGIPPDKLPRVFDLFTQLDTPHERSQGGLGIGLTLVRSLVQMHGGTVTAFSKGPNQGSEFVVRLPLVESHSTATTPSPSTPTTLGPLRILVVDDNHDAAESLGLLLKVLGAQVHVVYDGPAALQALDTFRPALVLMDIGMPGMDGYEVARWIRQQPRFRDLTLIALTGWGQEEDRRRSQLAGFNYHLIKPTDIDALQALMVSVENHQERSPSAT